MSIVPSHEQVAGGYQYICSTLSNVWGTITDKTYETSNYIFYGTQAKRRYYPFNAQSIKDVFCKFSKEDIDTSLKIWNIVKDNNGKIECFVEAFETTSTQRSLWEQSALEFKCRDHEFIVGCINALELCDNDDMAEFMDGIMLLRRKYNSERKYMQENFFNEIYQSCLEYLNDKVESDEDIQKMRESHIIQESQLVYDDEDDEDPEWKEHENGCGEEVEVEVEDEALFAEDYQIEN